MLSQPKPKLKSSQQLSHIWDSKYTVEKKYRSIIVQLRPQTKLELGANFLKDNKVNAFRFYGTKENDQVEVTEHAFRDNSAGFPEIEFFGVRDVFLQAHAIEGRSMTRTPNAKGLIRLSKKLQVEISRYWRKTVAGWLSSRRPCKCPTWTWPSSRWRGSI